MTLEFRNPLDTSLGYLIALRADTGAYDGWQAFQSTPSLTLQSVAGAEAGAAGVTGNHTRRLDFGHGEHDAAGEERAFLARLVRTGP